ncbi:hemoglobin subunit beta-2-like [Spea bombifrons]|uniref:hemoglobin subunit beta-2-like n=1 Tax=Spea bombifrons TaxID=233779 RepID=UPI002349AFB4|nr:hemoglobin subunit beta-2-like [Spea bombifrons]
MVLFTPEERAAIAFLWQKVDMSKDGSDLLNRLLIVYPWTQNFNTNFGDLSNKTAVSENVEVQAHGEKVLGAIGNAIQQMDDVEGSLHQLSDTHANKMLVDPDNFKRVGEMLETTMAAKLGSAFTPQVQAAWRKFIVVIVAGLTQAYY